MTEKLRVGIIGCGGIARHHARGYLNSGRYEIVALADLSPVAMKNFDNQFGLEANHYPDARKMLDEHNLDVVSVCTWHTGHATWTIAAAARQPKAILCEKPMADTLGRAEEMVVACHRNGVKLAIAHQRRFLPAYTLTKDLIAEGAIGQVELIISVSAQGLPNYASHQTDMYRYILGDDECEWVMGNVERKTDRYERGTRIEDAAVGVFQFKGGARALILADVTPTVYQGAQVYGSEGLINFTTTQVNLLTTKTSPLSGREAGSLPGTEGGLDGQWKLYEPDGKFFKVKDEGQAFEWLEGSTGQANELADWVEGKVEIHRGQAQHGYKALEMLMAIYESARCHEKVTLPLHTRVNPLDLMVESGHLEPERPGRYDIRAFLLRGEEMRSDDPTQINENE